MARVKNNGMIEGISGMVGDYVFRQVRGKTIICLRATKPRTQSSRQAESRNRFRLASAWAKEVLLDPKNRAHYEKQARRLELPNAYTAAIGAYMRGANDKSTKG